MLVFFLGEGWLLLVRRLGVEGDGMGVVLGNREV